MTGLRCLSGVELLADYLEGVLDPALRADLEGHVAGCPGCQAFLESYRATPRILRDATDELLPAQLRTSLRKALRLN